MSQPSLRELLDRLGTVATLYSKCVIAVHHLEATGVEFPTTKEIREAMRQARVPRSAKLNVSGALSHAGGLVDVRKRSDGASGWTLTDSGRKFLSEMVGLPVPEDLQEDVSTLIGILENVSDSQIQSYLEEAVDCLRVGARRAFVIMVWQAAIYQIRQAISKLVLETVNDELLVLDPKARRIRRESDFDYIKEGVVLLLAQRLALFDKGQTDELTKALDLRNKCGHPGNYRVGPKKASAMLEDLVNIVFSRPL